MCISKLPEASVCIPSKFSTLLAKNQVSPGSAAFLLITPCISLHVGYLELLAALKVWYEETMITVQTRKEANSEINCLPREYWKP